VAADSPLARLSERVGIEPFYWDVYGTHHETTDDTRRKFLAALGYRTDDDDAAEAALTAIEERPWRRMVEPVTILRLPEDDGQGIVAPNLLVVVAAGQTDEALSWVVQLEDGRSIEGSAHINDLPPAEHRDIDGKARQRLILALPGDLPHGYHRVRLRHGASTGEGALIVAPATAYRPAWLAGKHERVWGIACQLYALRSPANWGIGDFTDLADLCACIADHGGDAVGLPPLHALFAGHPELVSPYSPSSRLLLNPLYIDVTRVPEYTECADAGGAVRSPGFAARLDAARAADAVAFTDVAALKGDILNMLFDHFERTHPPESASANRMAYDAFATEGGERLNRLALFEAMHEHFAPLGVAEWPPAYRDPASAQTAQFARIHAHRVRFHIYQQWQADRQLEAAAATCAATGMAVGLYRDLAVGVAPAGADVWVDPDAFVSNVRFGAPPDPLGPAGQDWGMPPYNPERLYECAYEPYIAMLRANMRHAGALRIDHVMWLQHLFWIPPDGDGRDGAYVHFPFDHLLAILALESRRNRCLVIGEDLGTVPEGFRDRLAAEGVLSYRLLQFERHLDGMYKRPDAYPAQALATPGSHDLPTLAGFWRETDIRVLRDIGLIATEDAAAGRRRARAHDRALLIAALFDQGLLPADFPNAADIGEADLARLIAAVHGFLARSPAALMMMNLEDIVASTEQVNVPGTVDEYPNWRLKLPFVLEPNSGVGGLSEIAERVAAERAAVSA